MFPKVLASFVSVALSEQTIIADTCGYECDTDADCAACGDGGGRCSKPFGDDPQLVRLTATCVETSSEEPPTEPAPDYHVGVQPLQHFASLRVVEYPDYSPEVWTSTGNVYYDGTRSVLRHDWSDYQGKGKQTQIWEPNGKYCIIFKFGLCIDFFMKQDFFRGAKVGIPTRDWLNTCAETTGNLVYVGRELVQGEWTDHYACYSVVHHENKNTSVVIAFQNWHSLGLGVTKLGQPLRVTGSNGHPTKFPDPASRLTTMWYTNISDGAAAVADADFDKPRFCLPVDGNFGTRAALMAEDESALPTSADLTRARQKVPRPHFTGATLGAAMVKLNAKLLAEEKLATQQCESHTLDALHKAQRAIFDARSHALNATYPVGDGRLLPYWSAEGLAEAHEWQLATGLARPDLMPIVRDGLCQEIVMMYVHHLSEAMRETMKTQLDFVLPLLPEHELHPKPEGDSVASEAHRQYIDKASCAVCHLEPSTAAAVV